MEECPQGAVSVKVGKVFTEAGRCTGCETCIDICVNNAREICGKTYGIQELQKKLRNYINYPVYIGG
jgi:pyruvate formate lyase activating enzyme